jgi:DNA-directed RNA polymerase subunit E'
MYYIDDRHDVVRIPPSRLGTDSKNVIQELAREQFEGKFVGGSSLTVTVMDVNPVGNGRIIHGDGGVYQDVDYRALLFRPELHEVIEGQVVEICKFGAFVRIGPLDGLLHVSQVLDERVNVDERNQRLIGVESKKDLKVGHKVRVRIVSLSLSEISPRDSRIGLTMRQPGLGRLEWIVEARKKKEKGEGRARSSGHAAPAAATPHVAPAKGKA